MICDIMPQPTIFQSCGDANDVTRIKDAVLLCSHNTAHKNKWAVSR